MRIKNTNCYKVIPLTHTVPASTFLLDNRSSFPKTGRPLFLISGQAKALGRQLHPRSFQMQCGRNESQNVMLQLKHRMCMLPVCNISHFCRTSTSPLHFHLCASRQQGKQQWAFYFDLSFGFPHDLSHGCSQTDISPPDSPPYRNQGVSFHHKTEDTSSSTWPSEFSYYSIMVISGNQ